MRMSKWADGRARMGRDAGQAHVAHAERHFVEVLRGAGSTGACGADGWGNTRGGAGDAGDVGPGWGMGAWKGLLVICT